MSGSVVAKLLFVLLKLEHIIGIVVPSLSDAFKRINIDLSFLEFEVYLKNIARKISNRTSFRKYKFVVVSIFYQLNDGRKSGNNIARVRFFFVLLPCINRDDSLARRLITYLCIGKGLQNRSSCRYIRDPLNT